jgi:hypothetical protein
VPYPDGGYAPVDAEGEQEFVEELPTEQDTGGETLAPEDELTLDDLPTEQDTGGETLAPEDELTLDELPTEQGTGAETLAPEDELTLDSFPTEQEAAGGETLAPEDELTLDSFPSGEAVPSADASADLGEVPVDSGTDALGGVDVGFILERWQATLAVTVACIVGFVALNLVRGRQGRVWRAVRDDPVAAAVSGISPAKAKVSAFVVSSLFAAVSGAVFAQILAYVGPGAFGLGLSLSLLVGIVLGGRGSLIGALIGAVLLVWLPEFVLQVSGDRGWPEQVTNNAPNLIYGLLVVLVVLVAPGGIVGTIQSAASRVTRRSSVGK